MKSVVYSEFGEPEKVLKYGDMPLPEPKAGEVRIKTLLSPIHNHDIWTIRGSYGYKPPLPAIGGSEAVGTVEALGEGVENISVGTRVSVASVHGSWAEFFTAPATSLVPVPDIISNEAAAQIIAMPFSAISLLDFLNVKSGDWIIQNTANGAVGKAVAMLGQARGINVINLVRRDEAISEMHKLGIKNVLSTASPSWKKELLKMQDGHELKAAVDSIGGSASGDLLSALGEDGLLVSFGTMAGAPMELSSGDLIFKQATVKGFWGHKVSSAMNPEKRKELIGEIIKLTATGKLLLPVEEIFPFEKAKEAMQSSLAKGKSGKVLLKP